MTYNLYQGILTYLPLFFGAQSHAQQRGQWNTLEKDKGLTNAHVFHRAFKSTSALEFYQSAALKKVPGCIKFPFFELYNFWMQTPHLLDETRSRGVLQKFIFHTSVDEGHSVSDRRLKLAQTTTTKLIQCWYVASVMITLFDKITYVVPHCFLKDRKITYFPERSHDLPVQYLSSWV